MLRWAKARIGLKLTAVCAVIVVATAAVLIAASSRFAGHLGNRATDHTASALQRQATHALRAATDRQAQAHQARLKTAAAFSRTIARLAEQAIAHRDLYAAPLRTHAFRAEKGYWTNGRQAPASVIAWGGDSLRPRQRRRIRLFSHLTPTLRRAERASPLIKAAWSMSEVGTSRYVPNTPLVEKIPPADELPPLETRHYRVAAPARNPAQTTAWTRVYRDPAGGGLTATVATPFHRPGDAPEAARFAGVAGIDLALTGMTNTLTEVPDITGGDGGGRGDGFGFVMDRDGRLIAFPRSKLTLFGFDPPSTNGSGNLLGLNVRDSSVAAVRRFASAVPPDRDAGVRRIAIGGRTYVAAVSRVAATGWMVANLVPGE